MLSRVDRRYHEQMAKTLKILYTRSKRGSDGLQTIKLAFFDRDGMDCRSNRPLESFPVRETRSICSTMVATLRSRCGGLLQTVFRSLDPIYQRSRQGILDCWCPSGRRCPWIREEEEVGLAHKFRGFTAHSMIVFIHRALFEFLDNPNVWTLPPLRISDPAFSVRCAELSMKLQLEYLYGKNHASTLFPRDSLRLIDRKPLECVVPVLAKVADFASLKVADKESISSFLEKSGTDRSSLQVTLLMAVELGLINTARALFPSVGL